MAALVRMLRRDINGAVVERMEQLGIRYEWQFGGSACMPSGVRPPCSRPTTLLPGFLYGQNLRELLLSAFVIADPCAVSADELAFWGAGVKNSELAENLAFSLLSHTSLARPLAEKWLAEDAPSLLRYSALLALSRMRGSDGRLPDGVDGDALAARFAGDGSVLVRKAAEALAEAGKESAPEL